VLTRKLACLGLLKFARLADTDGKMESATHALDERFYGVIERHARIRLCNWYRSIRSVQRCLRLASQAARRCAGRPSRRSINRDYRLLIDASEYGNLLGGVANAPALRSVGKHDDL
jgi:hypothetical protein